MEENKIFLSAAPFASTVHRRHRCQRLPDLQKHKLNELRDARPPDEVEEEDAWIAFKQARAVSKTKLGRKKTGALGVFPQTLSLGHRVPEAPSVPV